MCTRVFNNRNNNFLTTARNMDWKTQLPTCFFSFQSGLQKSALSKEESETMKNWEWTSKYRSIVTMVGNEDHGFGASDGINSEGLVANVLYAKETDYTIKGGKDLKKLSVLRWVQYVLDNFKNTKEVVVEFERKEIELVESIVPGSDSPASLHLSVSDIEGNSAIIEVYDGAYHIHEGKQYNVMTNEPNFEVQLKLNDYWLWQWSDKNTFPSHTIPGGPFPADRFERATYYYQQLERPNSVKDSLAQSRSVVANASVPIGIQGFAGHPNIAPTLWTTLSDHNQLIYYFYNIRTPDVIWLEMNGEMPEEKITKLELVSEHEGIFTNHNYVGCVNSLLKAAQDPYKPLKELV